MSTASSAVIKRGNVVPTAIDRVEAHTRPTPLPPSPCIAVTALLHSDLTPHPALLPTSSLSPQPHPFRVSFVVDYLSLAFFLLLLLSFN